MYYLVVKKTEDDSIYYPYGGTTNLRKAKEFANRKAKSLKNPKLHVVIEAWKSEEDYESSSGSVETIYDVKVGGSLK